jgi:hypothetical protein
MNKSLLLLLGVLFLASAATAQEFPLTVHVKQIREDKHVLALDGDGGGGGTRLYHLVIAEIDGHTYGLEVHRASFHTLNTWLHVGDYTWQTDQERIRVPIPR